MPPCELSNLCDLTTAESIYTRVKILIYLRPYCVDETVLTLSSLLHHLLFLKQGIEFENNIYAQLLF